MRNSLVNRTWKLGLVVVLGMAAPFTRSWGEDAVGVERPTVCH